jgi:hypothetical protein
LKVESGELDMVLSEARRRSHARKGPGEEQIAYALQQVEGGQKVSEVCREMRGGAPRGLALPWRGSSTRRSDKADEKWMQAFHREGTLGHADRGDASFIVISHYSMVVTQD